MKTAITLTLSDLGLVLLAVIGVAGSGIGCGDDCCPTEQSVCQSGRLHRVNSCGQIGRLVEECEHGCQSGTTYCAGCQPASCQERGLSCGDWPDDCGGLLSCGDCPGGGICDPAGACEPGGWTRAAIASLSAPNQTTVDVVFDPPPGDEVAADVAAYSITAPEGGLEIHDLEWASALRTLRITTARQRLGVTYRLHVATGEDQAADLEMTFLAADRAMFWASDFGDPDFAQYQLVAERAAVGHRCVVYLQEGMQVGDLDETVADFDERIYPILTENYTLAPDVDGNGRIVLLGLDGGHYYGGYFSAPNQYPESETWLQWRVHSNEMDMIYINAIAGSLYPDSVIPHEFSHLLYHQAHGYTFPYWAYHDEGLAECAVGLVHGINQYAVDSYLWDPDGVIGEGLSLVHWTWGSYSNYVQAYLFWTYLAARTAGPEVYGQLFDLPTGAPEEVDAFVLEGLGIDFPTALRDNLLANWVQAPQGAWGYAGMISFQPAACPTVPTGTTSVDLEAFSGAFFRPAVEDLDYPGSQGGDIVYAGIAADGSVDLAPPFSISGGALLVFNTSTDWEDWDRQASGPDVPSAHPSQRFWGGPAPSPAWSDPPPLGPHAQPALQAWQRSSRAVAWPALRRD